MSWSCGVALRGVGDGFGGGTAPKTLHRLSTVLFRGGWLPGFMEPGTRKGPKGTTGFRV